MCLMVYVSTTTKEKPICRSLRLQCAGIYSGIQYIHCTHLNAEQKDLVTERKYMSVTWSLGVLYFLSGHPSSPFSLICVIAQMNQCHRCWEHLLSTLAPWATPLMDTNYKISAPWGDIAQALPHSPEGVWSGQCVCVCMSVLREQ